MVVVMEIVLVVYTPCMPYVCFLKTLFSELLAQLCVRRRLE